MNIKSFFHFGSSNLVVQLSLAFLSFFAASKVSAESYGHYNILIMLFSLLSFFHSDYVGIYYIKIAENESDRNISLYLSNFLYLLLPIASFGALLLSLFKGLDVLVVFTIMMLNQFSLFYINYLRVQDRFSRVSRLQVYSAAFRLIGIACLFGMKAFFDLGPHVYSLALLYGGMNIFSVFLIGLREESFYTQHVDKSLVSMSNLIQTMKEGGHLLIAIYLVFFLNYLDRFVISILMPTRDLGIVSYYKLFGGFIMGVLGGAFNGFFYPKVPKMLNGELETRTFYRLLFLFWALIVLYNIFSPGFIRIYTSFFSRTYLEYYSLITRVNLLSSFLFFIGVKNTIYIFSNKKYYVFINFLAAFVPIVSILLISKFFPLSIANIIDITLYFMAFSFVGTSIYEFCFFRRLRKLIGTLCGLFISLFVMVLLLESYVNVLGEAVLLMGSDLVKEIISYFN